MHSKILPAFGLAACAAFIQSATAVPLSFNSYAQVYGYVNTSYTSPYLGDINFQIQGTSDYQYSAPGALNPAASAAYTIAPGGTPGVDPVYDIVTSGGAYGFGYTGTSSVSGTNLHSKSSSSQVDATMTPVDYTPNTSVYTYTSASWNQQLYLAPTGSRPAGSYGAILVGITMDGTFPSVGNSYAYSNMSMQTSFQDTAGVSYSSNFSTYAQNNDSSWTGSSTVFKKLLFQYGTVFNLNAYLQTYATGNSEVDFSNTGKISSIEIPLGAVLDSGAQQAGLGNTAALYGTVFNSATADAQNTNWDFGNNGGGFTPSVPGPEPGTWAMMLAGMAAVLGLARRRRRT